MDNHTPDQRHKNMKAIKSKNTQIELLLRKELWKRGLRYQKNSKKIYGKPDIVFIGKRVAVFCDSEFWHGFNWKDKKAEIQTNREFWIAKIEGTIKRDMQVTNFLQEKGWIVLRFWGNEIKHDVERCADIIERTLLER